MPCIFNRSNIMPKKFNVEDQFKNFNLFHKIYCRKFKDI